MQSDESNEGFTNMIFICSICTDMLTSADTVYATNCGHIFHHLCIQTWVDRSKSCPQCRTKVTDKCMFRVYLTVKASPSGDEACLLQIKLDATTLQYRMQSLELKSTEKKLMDVMNEMKQKEERVQSYEKQILEHKTSVQALKQQLAYLKEENVDVAKIKEENESLKQKLLVLHGLQKIFDSTVNEVTELLEGYTNVRILATFATALKKALVESESKKTNLRNKLQTVNQELADEKRNCSLLQSKYMWLEEKYKATSNNYGALKNKLKLLPKDNLAQIDEDWESVLEPQVLPTTSLQEDENVISAKNRKAASVVDGTEGIKTNDNPDSPYLNLKQSGLGFMHTQLRKQADSTTPTQMFRMSKFAPTLKPSEYAILNSKRPGLSKKSCISTVANTDVSIFHNKQPVSVESSEQNEQAITDLNISYDGFGGHSKWEEYSSRSGWRPKSCVPKVTVKHKLKRPNPAGCQDIGKMLKIHKNNSETKK